MPIPGRSGPTGFEGFTSRSGALLFAVGGAFGAGPRSDSGVGEGDGVGAGFTRRGRDWALAIKAAPKTVIATIKVITGVR